MVIESSKTKETDTGKPRRKKLTAREKWQIFLETSAKDAPVGEILRRYGLYSSDLTRIRQEAETGALKELGRKRYSRNSQAVPYQEHERIKRDLAAKEKALAQMSEEYLLLKKRMD
jgi:transposase-like protein